MRKQRKTGYKFRFLFKFRIKNWQEENVENPDAFEIPFESRIEQVISSAIAFRQQKIYVHNFQLAQQTSYYFQKRRAKKFMHTHTLWETKITIHIHDDVYTLGRYIFQVSWDRLFKKKIIIIIIVKIRK